VRRPPSSPPELPGYDYLQPLGTGGFSDVYLYEQRLPRRKVAVKVLLTDDLSASNRSAFVAEANLMAQLSAHPYIVTIYHADVAAGDRPYFVMEYCSGPSLGERYKKDTFGVADALRTGVRLSSAIATAHSAGILHRDIKPANVLTNAYGWPALTDFGISSAVDDSIPAHTTTLSRAEDDAASGTTGSQSIGMSVPWSPPEMFEDDPQPDVRSDVFSLAATIHTLLAGRTPFEIPGRSNGTLDLIGRIERGAITPIQRDDIPRSLIAVLNKGMATRRSDRYDSAMDFARALQRIEMELGYAPTTIEVPNLDIAESRSDDEGGADETRARSVATIAAQPIAPPPTAPPGGAEETRARSVQVIQQPPAVDEGTIVRSGSPSRTPEAPQPVESATIVRPRRVAVETPAPAVPTEEVAAPRGRGRLVGIIIGVVAVLVIAAVVVAVLLSDGSLQKPPSTAGTPKPNGGGSAIAGAQVPTPKAGTAARKGSTLTFTWINPDPQAGDSYHWARADQPNAIRPSTTTTATLTGIAASSRVCIIVYLVRNGKESADPGLQECDPK
jgi:serine/threonine protein kinase